MLFSKKIAVYFLLGLVLTIIFLPKLYSQVALLVEKHALKKPPPFKTLEQVKGILNITPSSQSGKVKYPQDYTLVLVGDSMTEKLGNSDELKGYLNQYYADKTFEVLNYGFGSTNILSVPERLEKETFYHREFRPILDIDFDLILLESFGHNPLSNLPLQEGLKKQTETLDQIVAIIEKAGKKSALVFVATIAPNKETYAQGRRDLSPEERQKWAEERIAYIKNHIAYAKSHNIPIINIFEKSQDSNGDGKYIYIDPEDHIHPSPTGVLFISKQIADFIAANNLLHQ